MAVLTMQSFFFVLASIIGLNGLKNYKNPVD